MRVQLVTSPHLNHASYHVTPTEQDSTTKWAQTFVPMGLLSIATVGASYADIGIVDWNKAINSRRVALSAGFYDETAEWLLEDSPDIVGFMTECDSYHHIIQVCRRLKSKSPRVQILLGGVYATATHVSTLETFSEVDFILRGEGEIAFPQFLDALHGGRPLSQVGNLTYRDLGKVVHTPEAPLLPSLDDLPFPNLSLLSDVADDDAIWVEIGRGCPFKCNFCVTAPYWKRRHRIKSADRIIRELRYFIDRTGRTDFNFTHDLFTTDRKWVIAFCKALAASDVKVSWTCSSRTDTIDQEQIQWLKAAGCRDIYFGVEAGSASMQDRIDKNLSLEEADTNIRATLDAGISATLGFIVGLPGENSRTLRGTLDQAHKYLAAGSTTVHLFGFCPLRGSGHFDEILPKLVFDSHYHDFPLPSALQRANNDLIRTHFDVFTRYSRLFSYDDLSVDVIRAAEEYLPILNALRDVVAAVTRRGADPLELLTQWTAWIRHRNVDRGFNDARCYYGTISDYIDFLSAYCADRSILDEPLKDALRWERLKDEIRAKQASRLRPEIPKLPANMLVTNPSVTVERFDHIAKLFPDWTDRQSGYFAFYQRPSGEGDIVWLSPVASLILNLAGPGIAPTALERHLLDGGGGQIRLQPEELAKGMADLEKLQLLWRQPTAERDGWRESARLQ